MEMPGKSEEIRVLGLMSGTSLDGLDLCLVKFREEADGWKYEIEEAKTGVSLEEERGGRR